jgi:hypothetical protein
MSRKFTHWPATQNGADVPHTLPQAPQAAVVVVLVSQPSLGFPLQLPQPASHTGAQANEPALPPHDVVPCEFVQVSPQAPQFAGVPSWVSQPGDVVQLPNPAEQLESAQLPVLHEVTAFGKEQVTPQSPQSVLVRISRSQPLSGLPSQLLKPVPQLGAQS